MKAVVLAAGQGTRLRPLTENLPKCLVPLYGKPLLRHTLDALEWAGVRHCVVVVGYLGQQIRKRIGQWSGNLRVSYVENPRFQETNNLYSLWLARHELDDDLLLLEGDLLFESAILGDLLWAPQPDVAVVDRFQPPMDGTVILVQDGTSTSMVLKSEQGDRFDYRTALKTVNIYKLSRSTLRHRVLPLLDRYVEQGRTGIFYEAVLAELIARGELRLATLPTETRRWVEIDTLEDLRQAERLFPRSGVDYPGAEIGGPQETLSEEPAARGSRWFRRS